MTTENDVYARSLPETERKRAENSALEYKLRSESLTRLVANEDFRQWLSFVHVALDGGAFGQRELAPFEQGRRAALSLLLESLADANGFEDLMGEITARHYRAVRMIHENAHRPRNPGETR